MRLLHHVIGVAVFSLVFLLGRLMVRRSAAWGKALESSFVSQGMLGKILKYSGAAVQVIAGVWGFLDAVAFVILAT